MALSADTVWEVAERLHWSRPWRELYGWLRRAALGEAQAHLIVLERRGAVSRSAGVPERWRAAGAPG